MEYRTFGKTGEKISTLGFGCMRLPTLDGKNYKINEPLAGEMLRYAIDHGVNYLDTAYPYHAQSPTAGGMSEVFLGKALKNGYREKVKLATKLPVWLVQKREDMDRYLNEQLERLQTDHIDFYLLHGIHQRFWPGLKAMGVFEFLDSAVEDGRIRYAGFSFHDELDFFKEAVDSYDWSFCQIQYNFMDGEFQAGTEGLKYAAEKGLATVVMEPLRGGCLTQHIPDEVQAIWNSAEVKKSPAEWAFSFVWDRPEVNLVLSGMSTLEQVKDNIEIAERCHPDMLSKDEKLLINQVRDVYMDRIHVNCTGCGYCMPCPSNVNIPLNLSLLNDVYMYRHMDKPAENYFHLSGRGMNAGKCTQCGECEDKCPQHLPVRKHLAETVDIFEK